MKLKTAHTVLVAAAFGVAGLVLSERQSRRQLALQAGALHQKWISDVATDPELRKIWSPPGETLTDEEHKQHLYCHRLISLLSAKFHAGLLDKHALRMRTRWLMQREIARNYWKTFGGYHEAEEMDGKDRYLNSVMSDEYDLHVDQGQDPVAI